MVWNIKEYNKFGSRVVASWFEVGDEECAICSDLSKETHVHENGHDKRYKYVGMQCQNNGNQSKMSYTWKHI
jgi:hypothetical protein